MRFALLLLFAALTAGSFLAATPAAAQRDAAERLRQQAEERLEEMRERMENLPDDPQEAARAMQDQLANGLEAAGEEGLGERHEVSPAQGLVERKLAGLLDVKSTPARAPTTYVRDSDGTTVIAKVACELGDKRMIILPDGRADFVSQSATRPCDQPFKSNTRAEIERKMRANGFADFTFVHDGYYLYAYNCSEGFYQHTRSILHSMLGGVVKQLREWGLEVHRPETPLVVVIFPDRRSFDRNDPMPEDVAAYYSGLSNWVHLYEDTKLWDSAPEFAMKQFAYTVAHEGIHQVLHNTGIQQRLSKWPAWVSEGLPEYFSPLNVSSKVVRQGKSEMPERVLRWQGPGRMNDIRMWELMGGDAGGSGRLIREAVSYQNLTSYGYAISWGLTHYLAERKTDAFAAYLRELSKTQPLQGDFKSRTGPDPLFVKHFGGDFEEVELDVKRHLTSTSMQRQYKDPIENQTYYVIKRIYKKQRTFYTTVVLTRSPEAARRWRDKEVKRMDQIGEEAAFYTIICDNADEARYQIAKLSR